ncbi:trypsin-like serine protease [Desulfoglaeba alkanexedens]|uniref:trypsin-like serine protease n=1 Tax=Desulfoglaeba alkanexedens TaxID=361111 RepID=UPI001476BC38|nr:trypsin-like serine protease [Desulfoglaeba alkanexedens]
MADALLPTITTTGYYTDARYRAYPGDGYDGVVRVSFGGYYGTGTLLYDGHAVLTSAHLFEGRTGTAYVTFQTPSGTQTVSTTKILQHPGYDAENSNNDLAIVWLPEAAPVDADRYEIYRESDEIGQVFTFSGYGGTGTGITGEIIPGGLIRHKAANQFDADAAELKDHLGPYMAWTPWPGTQLIADFDSGTSSNDALGQLIHRYDRGLGLYEGLIAQGDSGSPAFLQNKVAGVANYVATLSGGSIDPDVDDFINSSFGEIAACQRVSAHQQWIDQSLRAEYPNAPTRPEEVQKAVVEGDSGTTYAYFLLQFIGVRSDPNEILSVDYATRDGSALSGSDYLAVSGTLNLYPDENQAVMPVEIIGDSTPEPSESFYLDVFNPVGGSFGDGVVQLTAERTILNDDLWPA